MTTRDKHIAQKKKEIEKIEKQQAMLIKKIAAIPTAPSKRKDVNFRRLSKVFALTMQVRSLEIEKQLIIAQPIPKYELGGIIASNIAIFRESGPEYIEWGNHRIYPKPLYEKVISKNIKPVGEFLVTITPEGNGKIEKVSNGPPD